MSPYLASVMRQWREGDIELTIEIKLTFHVVLVVVDLDELPSPKLVHH